MDASRSATAHVFAEGVAVADTEPAAVGEALPAGRVDEPAPAGRDAADVGAPEEAAGLAGTPDVEAPAPAPFPPG
ncbi:hypothetical protein ACFVXA_39675 [Streptomyces sp. NPDC058246]|uniref:hypothetical protein n=1 Tax=unclassified Streptomyces TaxID=2593676 RepID=UPI0036549AF5